MVEEEKWFFIGYSVTQITVTEVNINYLYKRERGIDGSGSFDGVNLSLDGSYDYEFGENMEGYLRIVRIFNSPYSTE